MEQDGRRHPNVVNLDEVEPRTREKGTRFGSKMRWLGLSTGARGVGCTWYEQAPGRTAFPRHYHCANEEALFVLSGRGEVRIGEETVEIRAGDYVTFPPGPEHAHCVTSKGDAPLRYLCLSTLHPVEVVGYPDSKKLGVAALPPGSAWTDPAWVRSILDEEGELGYFDREAVD